jgi:glycosyltransferase involved in cell wall biosynthesis
MHLGINAIRLCRNFTGVGRYIECILAVWAKTELPFNRVTLFTHTPLDQSKITFPLDRYELCAVGPTSPDPIWEATALRKAAASVDVLFGPSYLLEAFSRLKADPRVPLRLVLVGPDYLNLDIPQLARSHGVGEHVTHVPYATHADLPALYSSAEFFVFPASEVEGFGCGKVASQS